MDQILHNEILITFLLNFRYQDIQFSISINATVTESHQISPHSALTSPLTRDSNHSLSSPSLPSFPPSRHPRTSPTLLCILQWRWQWGPAALFQHMELWKLGWRPRVKWRRRSLRQMAPRELVVPIGRVCGGRAAEALRGYGMLLAFSPGAEPWFRHRGAKLVKKSSAQK